MIDVATRVAWSFIGKWYKWGGDDPSGFDCSGLVIEILKSVGKFPRKGDDSANGLMNRYPITQEPKEGCLVFWGNNYKATHVEYCINDKLTIGASGGGSNTKTADDAIRQNAFIKVRPIERDRQLLGFVDPFYKER